MFCKLFGHRFLIRNYYDRDTLQYIPKVTNFCVKCGILKNEVPNKVERNWNGTPKKAIIIKKLDNIDEILGQ